MSPKIEAVYGIAAIKTQKLIDVGQITLREKKNDDIS